MNERGQGAVVFILVASIFIFFVWLIYFLNSQNARTDIPQQIIYSSPTITLPQKTYKATDDIVLTISFKVGKRSASFPPKVFADDIPFKTKIVNPYDKEADLITNISKKEEGIYEVGIKKPVEFVPGKYTFIAEISDGQTITQDFTWGVLAINPDKSIYKPGETANISIAVLDDKGQMVCEGAKVDLEIISPSGTTTILSTVSQTILLDSAACNTYALLTVPDFHTTYKTSAAGKYNMRLSAATPNGSFTISDSFEVQERPLFDIRRVSQTRIFPSVNYPVEIVITPLEDFTGIITETVPSSFSILSVSNNANVEDSGDLKKVIWNAKFEAGKEYTLSYTYDPPDVSPMFYLLGPLTLSSSKITFAEKRQWQIASDADVTVRSDAFTTAMERGGFWGPYWVSKDVGYILAQGPDDNEIDVYKTSNQGANWSAQDTSNNPANPTGALDHWAAWWDGETPNDYGTRIHVIGITDVGANSTTTYWYFDTSTDAWSSSVTISTGGSGVINGASFFSISITKTQTGRLYASMRSNTTDQFFSSDNNGSSWTSRAAFNMDNDDRFYIFPSNNPSNLNDVWAIWLDVSANEARWLTYSQGSNSWGGSTLLNSMTIPGSGLQTTYEVGAAIRHTDAKLIVAFFTAADAAGTIEVREISSTGAVALTDVASVTDDSYYPGVFISQFNNDIYVVMSGHPNGSQTHHSTTHIYYYKSTNDGVSWSGPTQYSSVQDDYRGIGRTAHRPADGGRFMPSWFDDDDNIVFVNDGNDIEIKPVVGPRIRGGTRLRGDINL